MISQDTSTARRKESTAHTLEKQWSRGSRGISGVEVIVSVMLMTLNACNLVGKRVSFKSWFHKIPALEKGNRVLHIPQNNSDWEGQGVYPGWKLSFQWCWQWWYCNGVEFLAVTRFWRWIWGARSWSFGGFKLRANIQLSFFLLSIFSSFVEYITTGSLLSWLQYPFPTGDYTVNEYWTRD
jgi:hypothetical protein